MSYVPSSVLHDGKCADCLETKMLDEMVRKKGKKGTYRCNDCETIEVAQPYMPFFDGAQDVTMGRVQRLLAWCFG